MADSGGHWRPVLVHLLVAKNALPTIGKRILECGATVHARHKIWIHAKDSNESKPDKEETCMPTNTIELCTCSRLDSLPTSS